MLKSKHILQEVKSEEIINFANKVCRVFLRAIVLQIT